MDLKTLGTGLTIIGTVAAGVTWLASKDYVNERTRRVNAYVEGEVISKITRYKCRHPSDTTFDARLNEAQSEYSRLTGRDYSMPSCEKLEISPAE